MLAAPAAADAQTRRAVPRAAAPRSTVIVGARSYNPYYFYRPFYYGAYYSPWYYPFSFGVGFGYGYGPYWSSWGYSPYYAPWGYGPYSGYYGRGYDVSSSVRLQVSPREAEVYVDGYYAGKVDNFDGTFQRLHLEPGDHEVQLFMPGH